MPIAFVAGATGYSGRVLVEELAQHPSWKARPHARAPGKIENAVVCDPRDVPALSDGIAGCDAVVQMIGTVRAKFDEGDYEAIDYGTTVALCEAARQAGVPRILLLSSAGAGSLPGRYPAVKRKTEAHVEASGLEYTILRPSFISGPGRAANRALGVVLAFSSRWKSIDVRDLARVFVRALERREDVKNKIFEGDSLWALLK